MPEWFFEDSLNGRFTYHVLKTDIGLIQANSMSEDLSATLQALEQFFFDLPEVTAALVLSFKANQVESVICDISPLGILVAEQLGLPVCLVENFTWDWIYENYLDIHPEFLPYIEKFKAIYAKPYFHIQAEPVCLPTSSSQLTSRPISRSPRLLREPIRAQLQIPSRQHAVLVTMGGIPTRFQFLDYLAHFHDACFVVPGASDQIDFHGNLRLIPHHSAFYHPDLMNSADAVIGKSGYSTTAEAYWAGIPFGYIMRHGFRESDIFSPYIQNVLGGIEFTEADFENGHWKTLLAELLTHPRMHRAGLNGAETVAKLILNQ